MNNVKVPTAFVSDKELVISLGDLKDGANTLVVNQMGSSDTIFRSSNEISYLKSFSEAPETVQTAPVEDTIEQTPNSTDQAINGDHSEDLSEDIENQNEPADNSQPTI